MNRERFKPLRLDEMTPEQRAIADRLLNGPRKMLAGPFPFLLRVPALADSVERMGDYLRFHTTVPQRLNELAIIVTARKWTSQFEWYAHRSLAIRAGLDSDTADQIAAGRRPSGMKRDEQIIFDFTAALVQAGHPSEDQIAAVIAEIGEQGLIDLTSTIGFYCQISMLLNVGNVGLPDGVEPPLRPIAEGALFAVGASH